MQLAQRLLPAFALGVDRNLVDVAELARHGDPLDLRTERFLQRLTELAPAAGRKLRPAGLVELDHGGDVLAAVLFHRDDGRVGNPRRREQAALDLGERYAFVLDLRQMIAATEQLEGAVGAKGARRRPSAASPGGP